MDRLAQYRAQQQGAGQGDRTSGYGGGEYSPRPGNPYAPQQDSRTQSYEMSSQRPTQYGTPAQSYTNGGGAGPDDLTAFYDEISNIQEDIARYNGNITAISDLQQRALSAFDDAQSQAIHGQLERFTEEQVSLSSNLKRRIQALEAAPSSGRNAQIKAQQTAFVKSKFVEAIQTYQQAEQKNRQKHKERIGRQYKIVNQNATDEEIRAVVNNNNNEQIFTQALMNSDRYGQSRDAYREVQARNADIKKIEKTLTELAQLFNEMSVIVQKDDETIDAIVETAHAVSADVEKGKEQTDKAVLSAWGARKKKWILFWIIVVIIIVIVLAVILTIKPWENKV